MKTTENGDDERTPLQYTSDYFEGIKDNIAALRKFFTAMPKGGDVHNHLTGSAYAETYFELAVKHGMYVDMETGKLYKEKPEKPETIQLSKEMDDLHNHRMTLIDKWSIRNFQPYKYPLGPDEYFFGTFGLLSALTSDTNDLAHLMHELKVRAVKENVQYLEVIGTSPSVPPDCFLGNDYKKYDEKLKDSVKNDDHSQMFYLLRDIRNLYEHNETVKSSIDTYLSSVQDLEDKSNEFENHFGCDITKLVCRYQGYASRGGEPLKVFAQLYIVKKACENNKGKLLTGCNLVAAENGEKSMLYNKLQMTMFAVLNEKHDSYFKIALHAGELTLGLVRPEHLTYHIELAVRLANPCRIGHGVDIPFESNNKWILEVMKNIPIPMEINLTSNEFILGVKGTEHPIRLYHEAGIPVIISTDDPGILRTSLTEQYVLAASRYGFTYEEIKTFVYNSIYYSFLPEIEITDMTNTLNRLFEDFESTFEKKVSPPAEADSEENES